MGQRNRQKSMGLDILTPADRTLWKRALKPKTARRTKERKRILGSHTRNGMLAVILKYLKDRVNENNHRG